MYYVVEVSTKPIEEKINRVWEVDVCTFFPEGPVTHTTSLSLAEDTALYDLAFSPALRKYAILSDESTNDGFPYVEGFRKPETQLEALELESALMQFLHETEKRHWDGYHSIFKSIPPHCSPCVLSSGITPESSHGSASRRRILYLFVDLKAWYSSR